ncbi:hypothetical protein [Herbiconiux solani]|uniref:hypothetical protein n=1 Tax=Herbiconiux solani TaxID=661329 RepID=UPI0012ED0BFD|nr:hypothetical protein [Herbiconiux solani]
MSLVHTLSWYRRHHSRHPDLALWPRAAAITRDDVTIAGESLAGMARAAGTPCTRVVEAAPGRTAGEPGPGRRGDVPGRAGTGEVRDGRPSSVEAVPGRYRAVVVSTVEAVTGAPGGFAPDLWLDAELDGCEPLESTFRLIGRVSRADDAEFVARPCRRYGDVRCVLPADVRGGDLVAFVVAHPVALHDLRRRAYHPERLL